MRPIRVAAIVAASTVFAACWVDPARDQPARIVAPTAASRAELERVVSHALNGAAVTLAADALVYDSTLIIEPRAYRDAQNNRYMGRDPGAPTRFRLLRHGQRCVLERLGSDSRWPLLNTQCKAE